MGKPERLNGVLSRKYDLQVSVVVGDVDYGELLSDITMVRDQLQSYSLFILKFNVNSERALALDFAFRQNPIFVFQAHNYFNSSKENENIFNEINLKLMVIGIKTSVSSQLDDWKENQHDSAMYNKEYIVYACSHRALLAWSRTINRIYRKMKLKDIVENVASYATEAKLDLMGGINNILIDEILIPPMNIVHAIKYLDYYYGFFNSNIQIWLDDNIEKCNIKIFSPKKILMSQKPLKIYSSKHNDKEMEKRLKESKQNYDDIIIIEDDIKVHDFSHGFSISQPYVYHFNTKPMDSLYKYYTNSIKQGNKGLVDEGCVIDKKYAYHLPKPYRNKWAIKFHHPSYKSLKDPYNEWFAKNYEQTNDLSFVIQGFVNWNKLIPGYPILYEPVSNIMQKYYGRYKITSVYCKLGRFNTEHWKQITSLSVTRANVAYEDFDVNEIIEYLNNILNSIFNFLGE